MALKSVDWGRSKKEADNAASLLNQLYYQ